jgi:hypothetical protein
LRCCCERPSSPAGLLLFIKQGSVFLLVVAMLIVLCFLTLVAWFQPYAARSANLFKVSSELALMVTLIFCVLLKMDRDSLEEDLPGGLDFFGSALIFVNSIVPGAALTVGVLLYGLEGIETEVYKADTQLHAFDNPLTVDEPLDDRE